jgi:hypothetical protein
MKIPKTLSIGGIEHAIYETPSVTNGKESLYGRIDYGDCAIHISSAECGAYEHKCVTMLHEALHGISHQAALNFKKDSEERIITALAFGVYRLFQDNARRLFDIEPEGKAIPAVTDE